MARIKDATAVMRKVGTVGFARRVWKQVEQDNIFVWASSLSYSWILALFPFLIFLLTLIPYMPENRKTEAIKEIQKVVRTLPNEAADIVNGFLQPRLNDLLQHERRGLLTIGIAVTLWAASSGMSATSAALDQCWDVTVRRSYFRRRFSAISLTCVVSFLLLVILFLLPVGSLIRHWVWRVAARQHWVAAMLVDIVRWALAVMVMFLILEVVYFFGPNVKQRWRWFTPGSIFCVGVWLILGFGFRIYVDQFGKYNQTYGAVGGVAVLLLIFYFDAMALLIGAEINSEIDFEVLGVPRGSQDFTLPRKSGRVS